MYVLVGDFRVSRGPTTVPITQILRNAVFLKSQNPRYAGTLCTHMAFGGLIFLTTEICSEINKWPATLKNYLSTLTSKSGVVKERR